MATRKVWFLVLTMAVLLPSPAWAGKTRHYPVEVEFRDASGDLILSDGQGSYVDGVDGVRAEIVDDRGRLSFDACRSSAKDKVDCPGPRGIFFNFYHGMSLMTQQDQVHIIFTLIIL